MTFKRTISIIIPAINEEEGIKETIISIPIEKLSKLGYDIEVIVVDGGSTDKTQEIAKSLGAKVIEERRKGYGLALRTGFDNACGDILVSSDADHTYALEELAYLIMHFNENKLDFLSTNRFERLTKNAMPLRNKLGNIILTFTTNLLFGTKFKDSQSGMWLIKKESWNKIRNFIERNDMAFSEEIKIEAHLSKLKYDEVPITYKQRKGKVKLKAWEDGIKNLFYLFKKRIKTFFLTKQRNF
ncbi:MAG: glycosyltransferase family 2 protein [Candidatus Anstonellales archaeon]